MTAFPSARGRDAFHSVPDIPAFTFVAILPPHFRAEKKIYPVPGGTSRYEAVRPHSWEGPDAPRPLWPLAWSFQTSGRTPRASGLFLDCQRTRSRLPYRQHILSNFEFYLLHF